MTAAIATPEEDDPDVLRNAMRKLMDDFATTSPKKAERKAREKKVRTVVDGRSLRSRGRSAQINIKVRPEVRERLLKFVEVKGVLIGDLFEQFVEGLEE